MEVRRARPGPFPLAGSSSVPREGVCYLTQFRLPCVMEHTLRSFQGLRNKLLKHHRRLFLTLERKLDGRLSSGGPLAT